ncbi:MAG TPA: hypothetical protein VGB98_08735 [Pyrinomonadaceae bacterium]|jgi:hypothetical protein
MKLKLAVSLAMCAAMSSPAGAQAPASQSPSQARERTPSTANAPAAAPEATRSEPPEPDPVAETRRLISVSLLITLANDARDYQNRLLRARVQARAADALWDAEPEQARQIFRRAWDDAGAADQEAARREEEARKKGGEGRGGLVIRATARNEVLRLVGLHDAKLADELLADLEGAIEREVADSAPAFAAEAGLPGLSPAEAARLDIAVQLAQDEHTQRALQLAGPALQKVTEQTVHFLANLRTRDAAAADREYAALLARSAANPASDANTVSLLSSYVFTPNFFVTVAHGGGARSNQLGALRPPAEFPAELRARFFQTAAQILLRPLLPPDQDATSSGRIGAYFTITRLLPLFERYAPKYVPEVRARLAALSTPEASARFVPGQNKLLTYGLSATAEEPQEVVDPGRVGDSAARDPLYADAAHLAATKGDIGARDLADRISDTDLRKQVRSYIDFVLVSQAVARNDVEKVLRLISTGDLTAFQRAWSLTEAARLLKKSDRPQALRLLDDAAAEARRIADGEPERVRALLAVAAQLQGTDTARTWQVVEEAVKAMNKAEGYMGAEGVINVRFRVGGNVVAKTINTPTASLSGLFSLLAKENFDLSLATAQNIQAPAPRASALISVARIALGARAGAPARR